MKFNIFLISYYFFVGGAMGGAPFGAACSFWAQVAINSKASYLINNKIL